MTNDFDDIAYFCEKECLVSELSTMEEGVLKTYYRYIDKRMKDIQSSDGPHAAKAFRFASIFFIEHGSIYHGLQAVLMESGNENLIDRFMKTMKFYISRNDQTSALYYITDIKTLVFYMGAIIRQETERQYPCPRMDEDYEIFFNEDELGFQIRLGKS